MAGMAGMPRGWRGEGQAGQGAVLNACQMRTKDPFFYGRTITRRSSRAHKNNAAHVATGVKGGREEVGNGGNVYAINAQLKIKTDTMAGPQRNKIQKGQSPQSLQFIRAQWREGEEGSVECGEGEGMREGKAVERLNGQHMQVRSHSVIKTNVKSGQTHRER